MFGHHKKEKPFTGFGGFGGGGFGLAGGGGGGGIVATISPGPDAGVAPGQFTLEPGGAALQLQKAGGGDFTISFSEPASIQVFAWGAGGGQGPHIGNYGGGGSKVTATMDVVSGQDYLFTTGGSASTGNAAFNGGGIGVYANNYQVGPGGGYSGVFLGTSKNHPSAILIAGGGGGGSYRTPDGAAGGSGGYPTGGDGANNPGSGGGQTGPGPRQLQGVNGSPGSAGGSGGGGGYYGGSAGAASNSNDGTGAGGGSSYGNPSYLPSFAATTPGDQSTSPEPGTYWPGSAGRGGGSGTGSGGVDGDNGAITIYLS